MKGDKLVIEEGHIRAARQAMELLHPKITGTPGRFVITIAGESGSGKSEIAASLAEALAERGISSTIFQQDDYFVYPPKTNEVMRRGDIGHVGMFEVRLDLLDQNLGEILKSSSQIKKPLVIFEKSEIVCPVWAAGVAGFFQNNGLGEFGDGLILFYDLVSPASG